MVCIGLYSAMPHRHIDGRHIKYTLESKLLCIRWEWREKKHDEIKTRKYKIGHQIDENANQEFACNWHRAHKITHSNGRLSFLFFISSSMAGAGAVVVAGYLSNWIACKTMLHSHTFIRLTLYHIHIFN